MKGELYKYELGECDFLEFLKAEWYRRFVGGVTLKFFMDHIFCNDMNR